MARGIIRKPSFNKIVGAYRSQWKRFWKRLLFFGYGRKGMGWLRDPKKACYNFWYHRTSVSVYRLLGCKPSRGACFCALLVALVASVFTAPADAARAAVKAHKRKKTRKKRSTGTSTKPEKPSNSSNDTSSRRAHKITARPKTAVPRAVRTETAENPKETPTCSCIETMECGEPAVSVEAEMPKEPDENTPKSKPKNEKDRYIRKRMIIAGSSYCDKAVLAGVTVGTYFDLAAEPDNPYDRDAVMLTLDGEKIGYIAKKDCFAFLTCLKQKRKMYGVITAIYDEEYPTKYEFETWFASTR